MFHIFFSADKNYISYTAVLITSIIKNTNPQKSFKDFCATPSITAGNQSYPTLEYDSLSKENREEGYAFHILSDSIPNDLQTTLQNFIHQLNTFYPCTLQFHCIDDNDFSHFPISGAAHSNHLPYYRLKWQDYIKPAPQKCLYLDSDMLVLCDLRELFALNLGENILAVVGDCGSKNRKIKYKKNGQKHTFYFDENYFNSGFLLINSQKYIQEKIWEKCENLAQKCTYIKAADQDLLNFTIPANQCLKLPFAYNFQCITFLYVLCKDECKKRLNYTRAEFNESFKNPKILHYGEKPWKFLQSYQDSKGNNINDIWWQYAKQTPIFGEYLLQQKPQITDHKLFAILGYYALQYTSSLLGHFHLSKLLKNNNDSKLLQETSRIPISQFGLCCVLGEVILYARKHKKGILNIIPKLHKIKRQYKKYATHKA